MLAIVKPLLASLALLVPAVAHAEELATLSFDIDDDYPTCLDRAQTALEKEGATTIRQAGDIVYGDVGQWVAGIHCEQREAVAVAVATGPDEGTASEWAKRTRDWYNWVVENP
jgi:hypothetical protein